MKRTVPGSSTGVSANELAATPVSSSAVASAQTLAELELARALDMVASFAVSDLGARAVRARTPCASAEWIREALADVRAFRELLDAGKAVEPQAIEDIGPVLERLSIDGSVLDGESLNALAQALEAMHGVRAGLRAVREESPRVHGFATDLPPAALSAAVARAIDADATVRDDASSELSRVRQQLRAKRKQLFQALERILLERQCGTGGVTVRAERYVIPVRRDDRHRVRGIVHGESGSGATLFVEPEEVVEFSNELSSLRAEEARAELRVLRALTEQFRPHAGTLADGLTMCVRVDDLSARARYAAACDASVPEVRADGVGLVLARATHPLLLTEAGATAVPFDLQFADGERVLLVSGPNAGGKTVLLKAVGLVCALAQSGVVPPVGPGTVFGVFKRIFVDIGDHQSIAASLSSFSAHVARLKQILDEADDESLVLLDELGGGTDPLEGAALAGAAVRSLGVRGSVVIATTHLSELKDLAARTPGVVNGSLRFDEATLTPTYQFAKGRPGRSYGLAIARRLGVPSPVLAEAEALLPEQARSMDAILADLERRAEAVAVRESAADAEAARLERAAASLVEERAAHDRRAQQLDERVIATEREGREEARRFLLQARRRVEDALALARAAVTESTAKEARRLVEQGVRDEADALAKLERVGWRLSRKDGGPPRSERREAVSIRPNGGTATSRGSPGHAIDDVDLGAQTELDLRGLTAEEAELALTKAIDGGIAADLPTLRIIHGKGTGALRARVAEVLQLDARVRTFRLAPPREGGSGVTIAELRR